MGALFGTIVPLIVREFQEGKLRRVQNGQDAASARMQRIELIAHAFQA